MSSKFAKQYQVPPEFPDILKDFTREVLRNQPENINEFAARYFECLASGLPTDGSSPQGGAAVAGAAEDMDMSLDEIERIIQDLFRQYDQDGSQYLDKDEFKTLMADLQKRLDFPEDEILRFLAEADMNADGMIEYEEFIPLALQIIQGMYAKKRLQDHIAVVDAQAEDVIVHGMTREELTKMLSSIFEHMDQDRSGFLSKQEFASALTSMELGLTRREINTIMFQVDQDNDGNISYKEFEPFAFDLLRKMTMLRLLETELEHDELSEYLLDLFKAQDMEMMGVLSVEDMRDLLHQAMLGMTRMQIYTVISEAEVNEDGKIAYAAFVPRAVGLVRSMLSFEKSIAKDKADVFGPEAEQKFFSAVDQVFAGMENLPIAEFIEKLQSTGLLNQKEISGVYRLLSTTYEGDVAVEEAKSQVWALVKSLRHASS
eukprot:TRINITY_DN20255_c3_g1_i1.p1 TRINITY_DN20255_c3_g1~~TRINITY_DN20255_c3_g1_i1.p1  ORF type:complete len:453 (-),score=97.99 TRINITY_DN20255_c3_g1_i1:108-1397(-)